MAVGLMSSTAAGAAGQATSAQPRVLLIIPCFNEERSVGAVLEEIAALGRGYDAVVVDDGSTDGTYAAASAQSRTLRLTENLGIGGAVQTGIKFAARNGYDFCVQIDGDGQHPPGEVVRLIESYRVRPFNLVVGSRFLCDGGLRPSGLRWLGSRMIAWTIMKLFRSGRITDPTSGMRLMDRSAIDFFSARYPSDFPEPISLAWALRSGLTVGETAVNMRSREHGRSSIAGWKAIAYMVRVLSYIALARVAKVR